MRFLLITLFGLALAACSENPKSVSIHGVVIGVPIESVEGLSSYEKLAECEIVTYYKSDPSNELDSITIHEMEGMIEGVTLIIVEDSFDDYMKEASTVFGSPVSIKDNDGYMTYEYKGKDIVSKAQLSKSPRRNYAIYATKKLDKNIERIMKNCQQ